MERRIEVIGMYRECEQDGFPMLRIRGRWECVGEYLNRCIGMKRVIDVIKRGDTVYYVFEDMHELPLLCFCCGEPLVVSDLGKTRQNMRGRKFESMSYGPVPVDDEGTEVYQFCLEFSGKTPLSLGTHTPVSVEVAAQLQHPAHCSQRIRTPDRKRKRTKRRRRR